MRLSPQQYHCVHKGISTSCLKVAALLGMCGRSDRQPEADAATQHPCNQCCGSTWRLAAPSRLIVAAVSLMLKITHLLTDCVSVRRSGDIKPTAPVRSAHCLTAFQGLTPGSSAHMPRLTSRPSCA